MNPYEFVKHQWLYWNDVERCPYATWSTSNPEERRKGYLWGIDDDVRMNHLAATRFIDWDRIVIDRGE